MLQAIFYARFHTERGPSVIHQYPNRSILGSGTRLVEEPLVNFTDISSYIIPSHELCNRPLSIHTNGRRVLGFPVSLEDAKYERNRFTFNVCYVFGPETDKGDARGGESLSWVQIVRKTAAFFRSLEDESGLLQAEEQLDGLKCAGEDGYPAENVGVIYRVLRDVVEQLSEYGETCISVNDQHTLNLRLERLKAAPPNVKAWDVPLLIREPESPARWTWDLTMERVHPHIDGTKHVQRIAEDADVELRLVKKAVRELIFHERAILLDLFHFQAIYALTADFVFFAKDEEALEECGFYVFNPSGSHASRSKQRQPAPPSHHDIISLYMRLTPGLSMHDFCLTHERQLSDIDVRRLITFGVIKGFVRRIHKHALKLDQGSSTPPTQPKLSRSSSSGGRKVGHYAAREFDDAWKKAAVSSGWATPPSGTPAGHHLETKGEGESAGMKLAEDQSWRELLDGTHCLDEMCVKFRCSERKVMETLKSRRLGEVVVFSK